LLNVEWTAESYFGDMLDPRRNHARGAFRNDDQDDATTAASRNEIDTANSQANSRFDKLESVIAAQTKILVEMQKSFSNELRKLAVRILL
jgi:hypothetical protein